jgi:t-SNARE complex subunit (syntaxin)
MTLQSNNTFSELIQQFNSLSNLVTQLQNALNSISGDLLDPATLATKAELNSAINAINTTLSTLYATKTEQ